MVIVVTAKASPTKYSERLAPLRVKEEANHRDPAISMYPACNDERSKSPHMNRGEIKLTWSGTLQLY